MKRQITLSKIKIYANRIKQKIQKEKILIIRHQYISILDIAENIINEISDRKIEKYLNLKHEKKMKGL